MTHSTEYGKTEVRLQANIMLLL